MPTPSFLRRSIKRVIGNKTLGPSGGQVYPPNLRSYTRLNGASWLQFVPVPILTGELVDGYFKVENDGYLLYGDDYVSVASGVITLSTNLTGTINGNTITSGVTTVTGGADYFVFTATADTSFSYIGYSTTPFVGTPYDVKFADKRWYKLDESYSESGIYADSFNADELLQSESGTAENAVRYSVVVSLDFYGGNSGDVYKFRVENNSDGEVRHRFMANWSYNIGAGEVVEYIVRWDDLDASSERNYIQAIEPDSVVNGDVTLTMWYTSAAQGYNITSDDVTQELV